MNKYVKLSLFGAVILFVAIVIIVQFNTANADAKKEAIEAFKIIETAFKEDRPLTEFEENELQPFLEKRDRFVEEYDNLKEKEKNDATLFYLVGLMYDTYGEDMEEFKEHYNEAKFLLE